MIRKSFVLFVVFAFPRLECCVTQSLDIVNKLCNSFIWFCRRLLLPFSTGRGKFQLFRIVCPVFRHPRALSCALELTASNELLESNIKSRGSTKPLRTTLSHQRAFFRRRRSSAAAQFSCDPTPTVNATRILTCLIRRLLRCTSSRRLRRVLEF